MSLALLARLMERVPSMSGKPQPRRALCAAAAVLFLLPPTLRYVSWDEFRLNARERAAYGGMWEQRGKIAAWLRKHAQPEEATLCDDVLAVLAVGSVGRGAVATMLIFSSPYVDAARRLTDRDLMFEMLRAKDPKGFLALARDYKVRYILATGREDQFVRAADFPFVSVILEEAPLTLYQVTLP